MTHEIGTAGKTRIDGSEARTDRTGSELGTECETDIAVGSCGGEGEGGRFGSETGMRTSKETGANHELM
jgi:hypothetical protein